MKNLCNIKLNIDGALERTTDRRKQPEEPEEPEINPKQPYFLKLYIKIYFERLENDSVIFANACFSNKGTMNSPQNWRVQLLHR